MSYADVPVRAIGGRLVLDFLNTADWSEEGQVIHEKLVSQEDVVRWTDALGISVSVTDGRPHDLRALRRIRSELRQLIQSAVENTRPDSTLLERANAFLALTTTGSKLVRVTDRPWLIIESPLLDLIITSAKALLSDPREIGRVRLCEGSRCGWLFVDESRNRRRKWCMMETCGNRAKARRHYASRTSQVRSE